VSASYLPELCVGAVISIAGTLI